MSMYVLIMRTYLHWSLFKIEFIVPCLLGKTRTTKQLWSSAVLWLPCGYHMKAGQHQVWCWQHEAIQKYYLEIWAAFRFSNFAFLLWRGIFNLAIEGSHVCRKKVDQRFERYIIKAVQFSSPLRLTSSKQIISSQSRQYSFKQRNMTT